LAYDEFAQPLNCRIGVGRRGAAADRLASIIVGSNRFV